MGKSVLDHSVLWPSFSVKRVDIRSQTEVVYCPCVYCSNVTQSYKGSAVHALFMRVFVLISKSVQSDVSPEQ